jgi:hypothetical protein
MALLAYVVLEPDRLEPTSALLVCFLLSDIGLLAGFTYFFITLCSSDCRGVLLGKG